MHDEFGNSKKTPNPEMATGRPIRGGALRKYRAGAVIGILLSILLAPLAANAQGKVIHVQTQEDAWQVRRVETRGFINVLNDPNTSQAEKDRAFQGLDARMTAAEQGKLTPIETMELFRVFYIPEGFQKKTPIDTMLEIIAGQATLGWYDVLRFADATGREEIAFNENFFTTAFGNNAKDFVQFMKDHPAQAAAAVHSGISYARDKIKANDIHYDTHWPASYGMLRMQCMLRNAKTCEKPKPKPVSEWPALLDQAAQRVSTFYRISKNAANEGPGHVPASQEGSAGS